ncbi:MAG: hypothetical protein IT577_10880 [Verrucomicrobiae bacterium]|nr:hypothetical protein [Verrucomicrobiae bacterium]
MVKKLMHGPAPALLALCFFAGCGEEPIRAYRVPKEKDGGKPPRDMASGQLPPDHPPIGGQGALPPDHPPVGGTGLPKDHPPIGGGAPAGQSAMAPMTMGQPPAGGAPALAWDAPKEWVAKPAGGMRAASFEVPGYGEGKGDLSVIVLGGGAGGLLPNINRWRGQIEAGPWDQATLDRESQKITAPAGDIVFVDLRKQPPGKRILGGVLERPGETWFFKLAGDDASLEAAKPAFMGFLKTVRKAAP